MIGRVSKDPVTSGYMSFREYNQARRAAKIPILTKKDVTCSMCGKARLDHILMQHNRRCAKCRAMMIEKYQQPWYTIAGYELRTYKEVTTILELKELFGESYQSTPRKKRNLRWKRGQDDKGRVKKNKTNRKHSNKDQS